MVWEFNKNWEQDYLIKTGKTLQTATDRRNYSLKKITKSLSVDFQSGTRLAVNGLETKLRNQSRFYFRTDTVIRTT